MPHGLTAEAERLLTSEPLMAHLATCREGRPHVAPVWYSVHEGAIEVATTGRKLANLRANPRVALSVQRDADPDPLWGVAVQGTAHTIEDAVEGRAAISRINRRYGEHEDAWSDNTAVRIDVGTATSWRY